MRPVRGMSYDQDDSIMYLTDLKDLRKQLLNEEIFKDYTSAVVENDPEKTALDEELERYDKIESKDDDEKELESLRRNCLIHMNSRAWVGGFTLKQTILYKSYCKNCIQYFVCKAEEDQQPLNHLISMREYKIGALTHPSKSANKMFKIADEIFHVNKRKVKDDIINAMTKLIIDDVLQQISDIPQCHLRVIINKFVITLWNISHKYQTTSELQSNKTLTKDSSNASKSMKAKYDIK